MLNAAQEAAVGHGAEEAVVVVAGPGSGKTHCLVSRVCKIISSTSPSSLLCITFTNKGVCSLRVVLFGALLPR